MFFRSPIIPACLVLLASAMPASAMTPPDASAATARIDAFDETLLSTMKDAKTLGYQGRFDRMAPAVDKAFDMGFMTKFLVGAQWNDFSAEQQAALIKSFRAYTIGQYANRFNGYDGETLQIVGQPSEQRDAIRVLTQLKPKADQPVKLDYILHHTDDGLKVIDIFLQGTISQLATQRSQFQSVLAKEGVDGLIAMLDKKAADASSSVTTGSALDLGPAAQKQ